ncbi:MAG: acyl-CoA dehydrogenase family protein [Dehalococcoidia bacterium]
MKFSLTEEQEMLKKTARDFLAEKCSKTFVRQMEESEVGYSKDIWQEMAELGWMGLAFPEQYGGGGMSFLDLAVLLEEMGRACLPGPFFSTVVLGGLTILDACSGEQKQRYLPGAISGDSILTMALHEPDIRHYDALSMTVDATPDGEGYRISGTSVFVPDAHVSDHLLCVASTRPEDGIAVFAIDAGSAGISYSPLSAIGGDKLFEVSFDRVSVPRSNMLAGPEHGRRAVQKVLERAAVASCCQVVGIMQRVLEMTVDYARERKQFDRPIGSFQVIQHYCAEMATDVDGARFCTYRAAWMLSKGLACAGEVATAKVWTGEASRRVLDRAHQIHGAIGVTMEHDLHFYTRRAKAAELVFGDADFHRETIARDMGL